MNKIERFHLVKLRTVVVVFALVTTIIFMLLLKWQIFDNDRFIAIANERYQDIRIPALRGSIFAADGSTLAFSEPRFDVYVWMPDLQASETKLGQTREEFINKVAPIIDESKLYLQQKLDSGNLWLKIASKITVQQRDELLNLKMDNNQSKYLQGIQFQYVNFRVYPEKSLASHITGFVGLNSLNQQVGNNGIEQKWDGLLKPYEGFQAGEVDSLGNLITIGDSTPLDSKPGVDIYTTIDKHLQGLLEQQLVLGVNKFESKSASGIIMDPKTGKILAMANVPTYDPNTYNTVQDADAFGNKDINTPYEIGSVAKVFTLSAALDLHKITPQTVLLPNGHEGCEIIDPDPDPEKTCFDKKDAAECICTYDRRPNHSTLTAAMALINSDNIGFRHIAETMSYDEFRIYLAKFGAGVETGIELAGESTGILKETKDWNYADQAVYSYGHGYQLTPLQAITGVATIANYGKRLKPYVVDKVVDANGQVTNFPTKIVEQVVTPGTADEVTDIMYGVFKNILIEKKYKYLSKYYIALKSGTALIPYKDRAGYSSEINATYIGFDASPQRKFILLIKLEAPKYGTLSYENARLVWLDTFEAIKDYLGVPEYQK